MALLLYLAEFHDDDPQTAQALGEDPLEIERMMRSGDNADATSGHETPLQSSSTTDVPPASLPTDPAHPKQRTDVPQTPRPAEDPHR